MKHIHHIIILAATLTVASACRADTIALVTTARVSADAAAIQLADIARIDGTEAQAFATLTVMPINRAALPTDSTLEIRVEQVRQALQKAGVHWGRVNLSGSRVLVHVASSGTAAPAAMTPVTLVKPSAHRAQPNTPVQVRPIEESATELISLSTVRGEIARMMVRGLSIDPATLHLTFDTSESQLLDTASDGARVELQPTSSLMSDRVNITVRLWTGNRVTLTQDVTLQPLFRVHAASVTRDVTKGQQLGENDLAAQDVWLPPSQASVMTDVVGAVGRIATTNLHAGDLVRDKNVRRESLIKRGDRVLVRCLVGGSVITMQAEARADGAAGDGIELRKLGERESFQAVVSGPSEAVLDLARK